ncbi:hypothetical protein [Natronospira bacteriovora]|uniref:Uncharacterized protein n=1 Tax=Natronospira bacteriovora TaxID=3069753 RepID=A0ABU0W5M9_9GAMM|nr:hypothetical protein [Natronospira sp. AB-CW4]MDQ2069301.1 hypothetical protein [Natronospira sp. AB-CW4]
MSQFRFDIDDQVVTLTGDWAWQGMLPPSPAVIIDRELRADGPWYSVQIVDGIELRTFWMREDLLRDAGKKQKDEGMRRDDGYYQLEPKDRVKTILDFIESARTESGPVPRIALWEALATLFGELQERNLVSDDKTILFKLGRNHIIGCMKEICHPDQTVVESRVDSALSTLHEMVKHEVIDAPGALAYFETPSP